ncbi:MAG: PBSX family phage terminase large subunit [Fusobacteriaceae bacterium]
MPESPARDYDGIIADGAIRSGKTLSMSLSYIMWAMECYDEQNFGMAGKTIGSFRRNVLNLLKVMLLARGYKVKDHKSDNMVSVSKKGKTNYFYIFGGKDERSQDLIQGVTLAGMFFDEVALMPESFVNQATGRCSVDGSKFWFNCNPDGPYHWFKTDWIDKSPEKNLLYLHFTMDDNLSLSEKIKTRYRSMYSGVFYDRYIRGLWCLAEGIIYSMFDPEEHVIELQEHKTGFAEFHVSCDYGILNPTAFGLWGKTHGNKHVLIKEYYHSGRDTGHQKTDKQYADDLQEFIKGYNIKDIIVDPSAASFIAELRTRKLPVRKAKNDVLNGIRLVASLLVKGRLLINHTCKDTIKEFGSYVWDEKASEKGEDKPLKENDHSMDQIRYYCNTIIGNHGIREILSR